MVCELQSSSEYSAAEEINSSAPVRNQVLVIQSVNFKYTTCNNILTVFLLFREKETHLMHLRNLEEELDAQVARVEAQAREEARAKYELEKRNIEEKMEAETAELQAHLRLFQKVHS
jgi:hypothetical protein